MKKQKDNRFVRKPAARNGAWVVVIADGQSLFAEELEVFYCGSQESAYQTYRRIKKEMGRGL